MELSEAFSFLLTLSSEVMPGSVELVDVGIESRLAKEPRNSPGLPHIYIEVYS